MVPSASGAWRTALQDLRETLPKRTVQNWIEPITPSSLDTDEGTPTLTLLVPTPFGIQYLRSRFRQQILDAVTAAVGEPTDVEYQVSRAVGGGANQRESEGSSTQTPASSQSSVSDPSAPERVPAEPDASDRVPSSHSTQNEREMSGVESGPARRTNAAHSSSENRRSSASRAAEREIEVSNETGPATDEWARGQHPRESSDSVRERSALYEEAHEHLRPEYTFEEFIEGDGNRLARSAAFAVAQKPGSTNYNPLLVYGGVGLGKTHLAQAVANYALEHNTAEKVLYVSSDRFTSQFVQSVRENRIAAFSSYYRQADLLIVDDVQFFGEKEKTQEEFFHIFNDLHQNGKQIFLCADRPPAKIPGIEERLLSRFQWGLSADIQRPELETRMAILQRKAARVNIEVEPKVLELIAQRIDSNVRQLEGALTRLTALVQLDDGVLDLQTARSYLQDHTDDESSPLDASDIIEEVGDYYRLSEEDLLSRSRKQAIAHARQVAMYLCRELTEESYSHIGTRFGGRDHSTVIYAHQKIEERMESDEGLRDDVSTLTSRLTDPSSASL